MGVYEFGPREEAVFARLSGVSRAMAFAGFALAGLLVAAGVAAFVLPPTYLPRTVTAAMGALLLCIAAPTAWSARALLRAALGLGLVATTAGHDVPHAVTAGAGLRDAFRAVTVMLALDALAAAALAGLVLPRGG